MVMAMVEWPVLAVKANTSSSVCWGLLESLQNRLYSFTRHHMAWASMGWEAK